MRVHIATDHAGMELSAHLVEHLTAAGYEMVDHGPTEYDAQDDYPGFCINAARAVVADREQGLDSLGIVLGGSGNGEQIAANKVVGVRAAWPGTWTRRGWPARTTTRTSWPSAVDSTRSRRPPSSSRRSWPNRSPGTSATCAASGRSRTTRPPERC